MKDFKVGDTVWTFGFKNNTFGSRFCWSKIEDLIIFDFIISAYYKTEHGTYVLGVEKNISILADRCSLFKTRNGVVEAMISRLQELKNDNL